MLESRSDLVSKAVLDENKIPSNLLRTSEGGSFGVFVEEAKDEWGFVHSSFREFTLARRIELELRHGAPYDLLGHYDQFDYVGAELLVFLSKLISVQDLIKHYDAAISKTKSDPAVWNKVVWNAYETIGNVSPDSSEPLLEAAVNLLGPGRETEPNPRMSYRTQYNVVRCIERLHPSAPKPYCEHVMNYDWSKGPGWDTLGAFAVRGFQTASPRLGYFAPMCFTEYRNTGKVPYQDRVSGCLLDLIEATFDDTEEGAKFLQVNCTFALIRWLSVSDIPRAKKLLERPPHGGGVTPQGRGNLFQAFLRFRDPEVFRACDALFEGMEVAFCRIESSDLPNDFVFRNVTFHKCKSQWIAGLTREGCT